MRSSCEKLFLQTMHAGESKKRNKLVQYAAYYTHERRTLDE